MSEARTKFPTMIPTTEGAYLTVIPLRSPERKAHRTLAHAKNALMCRYDADRWRLEDRGFRCDMAIYQLLGAHWVLLWEVGKGQTNIPWKEESDG